jgi:hypothetical protein
MTSPRGCSPIQREHGRDAVGLYAGNPTVHHLGAMLMMGPLLAALGTRNRYSASAARSGRPARVSTRDRRRRRAADRAASAAFAFGPAFQTQK